MEFYVYGKEATQKLDVMSRGQGQMSIRGKDTTLELIPMRDADTTALYLAITTEPFGAQIFIDSQGNVHTVDASLSHRGLLEDWLYFGRAEGDFDRTDWGIGWNETFGGYTVRDMDGVFETANDALRAAVAEFGITAEQHDDLIRRVDEEEVARR
jgi:hypothetical protein